MAKKIKGLVKLQVAAGMANPSPPVGPALGQQGVNIMEFCKAFNAKTESLEKGAPVPVVITVYEDRSFTFETKTPPASYLLKKAAGIKSGSSRPNTDKVGKVTRAQLEEIAKTKDADLTAGDLDDIVRVARDRKVDGMIVGNTTITRPDTLKNAQRGEAGGLSGKPLFELSTKMLAATYLRVEGQFPIIGVGGIQNAETAMAKIEAGATLLQAYSMLVYEGPGLVNEVHQGLAAMLRARGTTLEAVRGSQAKDWAAGI